MSTILYTSTAVTPRTTGDMWTLCTQCALAVRGADAYATREELDVVSSFLDAAGALGEPVPYEGSFDDVCDCCGYAFGLETGSYYGAQFPAR